MVVTRRHGGDTIGDDRHRPVGVDRIAIAELAFCIISHGPKTAVGLDEKAVICRAARGEIGRGQGCLTRQDGQQQQNQDDSTNCFHNSVHQNQMGILVWLLARDHAGFFRMFFLLHRFASLFFIHAPTSPNCLGGATGPTEICVSSV